MIPDRSSPSRVRFAASRPGCVPVPPARQRCTELKALGATQQRGSFSMRCVIGSLRLRLARIASMMRRSCSLRRRSRPPSAQTADTARLSMSAACFMDSSTLPPIGPLAASPVNDNILYHSLATRLVQVVARLPSLSSTVRRFRVAMPLLVSPFYYKPCGQSFRNGLFSNA